jgi:hypothetical protein
MRNVRPRGWVVETVLYAVVAVAITWPLATHLTTHASGSNTWQTAPVYFETPVNLWNLWWFRHAVVDLGQSPFYTNLMFHPQGADLWFHTLAPLPAIAGLLLQTVIGLVATYNALVLCSFVLAGLAASALAREVGLPRPAATLAGGIYAFSPALLGHLYVGHFELLWTFWIPVALLAFLRTTTRDGRAGWTWGALLGATIAATFYTSTYYAIYSVEALLVALALHWRQTLRPAAIGRLALAVVVTTAAVAPAALRFVRAEGQLRSMQDLTSDFRDLSVDPTALLVPSFMHPVVAGALTPFHDRLHAPRWLPQESTGYLGLCVVALAIAGFVRSRQSATEPQHPRFDRRLAAGIAIVFLLLSLGGEIRILERFTGIPGPAALLKQVPVLRLARAPGRHAAVAMLGIGLLAAAGWQRVRRRSWQAALVAVIAFEYAARVPLMAVEIPEAYRRIATEPGAFAVLDVPASARDGRRSVGNPTSIDLLGQIVHGKPLIGGMVSRLPDEQWTRLLRTPLIGALLDPQGRTPGTPEEAIAYFRRWNIQAIVIHREATPAERELIERQLPIAKQEYFRDGWQLWWVK